MVIASCPCGAKPLTGPINRFISYWAIRKTLQWNSKQLTVEHSIWQTKLKCHLQNIGHFVQAFIWWCHPECTVFCCSIKLTHIHYIDVTMTTMASQITSLAVVYSIFYSGADQRKHQSSASLAFVPVNSPHKGPVTRKMFPFDDVIMYS